VRISQILIVLLLGVLLIGHLVSSAQAELPVQGMPVPELNTFDFAMQSYMDAEDIYAAVLGIMKDDRIIYLRSFGYKNEAHSEILPENTLMRIASVNKPFTAAAIRHLIDNGEISLDQRAFTLDPTEDGILDYEPFGGVVGDSRLQKITVNHLLRHRGGWDRDMVGDVTYKEVFIALEMGLIPYRTPTRRETVEWILSQPLQHDPGDEDERHYANAGFLILGLIVEQVSGMELQTYWREHILPGEMWFPASEFEPGRTFAVHQNPREPWYHSSIFDQNVFDPFGPGVYKPYGGWDHEARIGQGGLISSIVPLLHLANNYYCNGDSIGVPLNGRQVTNDHDGRNYGTEALARQRSDGINYAILINKRAAGDDMYVRDLKAQIDNMIDSGGFNWPTQTVDGVWFDFDYGGTEFGSYDQPYDNMNDFGNVLPFSKIRFKPGSTSWTGTINQGKIIINAPEGTAIIGE
jgi:CubicO group peptidase (beta-lactamase class C family)